MPVELDYRDDVAIMTLNRPDALNALSYSVIGEIDAAIDEAGASQARALIITGAGDKAFCAGADIKESLQIAPAEKRAVTKRAQDTFAKLDNLPIASIALINGYAFGGGLELALACTFRLATPNVKMGLPEIKLGMVPGYGGTQRLPRLIGEGRALEIIMTGRTVGAAEAERIGLVNRLVDGDGLQAALDFAAAFTCYSLPVLKLSRDVVSQAMDHPIAEGLEIECEANNRAFQTADATEGFSAFAEKRQPVFKDD